MQAVTQPNGLQPNGLLQAYNMLTTIIVNVCDERE